MLEKGTETVDSTATNVGSVLDAALALNKLCSNCDTSWSSEPSRSKSVYAMKSAEDEVDEIIREDANAKNAATVYWLRENNEDFSGLTFPQKMHHALLNSKKYEHIISWRPSGRSFTIWEPKKFTLEIMPIYFGKQHIAYTSFTRRLLRWGWQNIARGTYNNINFHRDYPEKCLLMTYNNNASNRIIDFRPTRGMKRSEPSNTEPIEPLLHETFSNCKPLVEYQGGLKFVIPQFLHGVDAPYSKGSFCSTHVSPKVLPTAAATSFAQPNLLAASSHQKLDGSNKISHLPFLSRQLASDLNFTVDSSQLMLHQSLLAHTTNFPINQHLRGSILLLAHPVQMAIFNKAQQQVAYHQALTTAVNAAQVSLSSFLPSEEKKGKCWDFSIR